jgi:hypothetical protein
MRATRSPEPPPEAPSARRPRSKKRTARSRRPGRPKGARVAGRSEAKSLDGGEYGATLRFAMGSNPSATAGKKEEARAPRSGARSVDEDEVR